MTTMKSKEKPLKKTRVDSAVKKEEVNCFPIVVSAYNVETVVLLLESAEKDILLQALRALSKFAAMSFDNVTTLYNLDVMRALWRHLEHDELGVRRYALKLIAQTYDAPGSLDKLVEDDDSIRKLVNIQFQNQEDKFVQEFAALIFAKLTQSLEGCDKIIHTEVMNLALKNLTSQDPDVRKNNLQILMNALSDPEGADLVAERIEWVPLYKLIRDQYVDIQKLGILVLQKLLRRQKDFLLQNSFKATNGLEQLLDVMETYSLKHLHSNILDLLKDYNQTDEAITNFYESGCLTRFILYLDLAPADEKPQCLAVFLKMAVNKKGRELLHMCKIEDVICEVLSNVEISLWDVACQAAALMCKYCGAASRMLEKDIVPSLITILQNDQIEWEHTKENATILLAELFRIEKKAASIFIQLHGHILFMNYLKLELRADITQIGQENIVRCFINMEAFQDTRLILMTEEFFKEIMTILDNEDISLNKLLCEVLSGLMIESQGKIIFIANHGVNLLRKLMTYNTDGVKEECCRLIIISADESTTVEYIKEGILHLLTENKKLCTVCPVWAMAVNTLLSYHLPAKFHYCRELGYDDVTKLDFYAMKCPPIRFPEFEEIIEDQSLVTSSVYYCHIVDETQLRSLLSINEATMESISVDSEKNLDICKLSMILNDHHLSRYLRKIENIMVKQSLETNNLTLTQKTKIEILGKFVVDQMCGPDPTLICNNHLIDLHQNELKLHLRSNILPMGLVRVGGEFERAILFKVMADNLEIPAKLVCGHSTYIWIEVSILPLTVNNLTEKELMLNWQLLKTSHIVDLMNEPGTLMPLGSVEAALYCGKNIPLY